MCIEQNRTGALPPGRPVADHAFQERAIDGVLRTAGVLGPDEGRRAGDGDQDTSQIEAPGIFDDIRIGEPAGASHETHEDLVGYPHHHKLTNVGFRNVGGRIVGGRIVGKNAHRPFHPDHILRGVVDEEIDILGVAPSAMGDEGEAALERVPGAVRARAPWSASPRPAVDRRPT